MEDPEYKVKDIPQRTGEIHRQLNNTYKEGYEFVAVAINHVIYRKIKKHKKD